MQQWTIEWARQHGEPLPTTASWWLQLTYAEQREWARWRATHLEHRQLAKQAQRRHNRIRQRGTIRHSRAGHRLAVP